MNSFSICALFIEMECLFLLKIELIFITEFLLVSMM